jgi:predicted ATPase
MTPAEVTDCVAGLVAKSMIVANVSGPEVTYSFLNTIRAYALAKLAEAGELQAVTRRYEQHRGDGR